MAGPRPSLANLTQVTYRTVDDGSIAVISLNRPRFRNAISRTMALDLDACFQHASVDEAVKAIILRGEGDSFSSGHDLGTPELAADEVWAWHKAQGMRGDYETWAMLDVEACLRWRSVRKPVICAAKGFIIFHGYALMTVADIIVASEDVKLMPTLAQHTTLPWDVRLNVRKAKEIMMLQRFILAAEAEEIGIVQRVVPTEMLDQEVVRLARTIAKSDASQLRMMKLSVNQSQDAAGFSTNVRNNLAHWSAWRYSRDNDPTSHFNIAKAKGKLHPKEFAPISVALQPEVIYWSETAPRRAAGLRGRNEKL